MRSRVWGTMFGVAMAAAAPGARAADAEPIALRYEAPAGCPDGATFFGEVTARTSRARARRAGEDARVLVVRIVRRGASFSGELTIEDARQRSSPRDVTGDSCAEVVSALGLVAALAVDPAASVAPRPPPAEVEAPAEKKEPAPSEGEGTKLAGTLGAGAEASGRADLVMGLRVFGELELGGVALRLAAMRTFAVDRAATVGNVTLAWTTGAFELCPFRIDVAEDLGLRPCGAFAAGVLQAEGTGVRDAQSEARPWADAGAHARLSWIPARPLSLEIEGGATLALLRESFRFDPNVIAYQAPVIAGFVRFGAGVHFP